MAALPSLYSSAMSYGSTSPRSSITMSGRGVLGSFKNKISRSNSGSSNASPYSSAPATRRPDRPGMNAFTTPSNEPPPAYTKDDPLPPSLQVNGQSISNALAPAARSRSPSPVASTADDRYAFLTSFDVTFLIDDSGSMAGRSWRETSAALEAITPICVAHDRDGIDVRFLNARDQPLFNNITDAATVHQIFKSVKPGGWTPTGQRINKILKDYLAAYTVNPDTKPLNLIVITDGEPCDDVESPIIMAAKKLDEMQAAPWQIGIQFFQVGEEPDARVHLETLDDELSRMGGGCRDIVDTVPFKPSADGRGSALTADNILKVVLGSVNKRLDRRQA